MNHLNHLTPLEQEAVKAAETAIEAIWKALVSYRAAGFGSNVIEHLHDALALAQFAHREVVRS